MNVDRRKATKYEPIKHDQIEKERRSMQTGEISIDGLKYKLTSHCNDPGEVSRLFRKHVLPDDSPHNLFPCLPNRNFTAKILLGQGKFNKVYKLDDGNVFRMNLNDSTIQLIKNGSYVQNYLAQKCKYVCNVLDVGIMTDIAENKGTYAIMEPFDYDLEGYFKLIGKLELPRIKKIFYDVLQGIRCINKSGYIHRDIKFENIGVTGVDNPIVKIFDFDFVVHYTNEEKLKVWCGTPGFIDPLVEINEKFNIKSDMYSFGIMLEKFSKKFSPMFKDDESFITLITCCKDLNFVNRWDADAALQSQWFDDDFNINNPQFLDKYREYNQARQQDKGQRSGGGRTRRKRRGVRRTRRRV